ncbi:hypothetical protein SAMN02982929_06655 [Saccharopolyspora kobensis]|uniref:Cell wall anchor protein n=1 Tax=Saccharopolyspora kobensis TaxID=146035 RepID=A0A1H6EK58_9PSEU|nr:DUF6319 family protein [Saccharopolyspora kobensis]SEG97134.1 hypothetical protein SAMN02982929_06655 [Saccharopolyspora kobensis]SFE66901.1 hypothetical protein SAMN05216506_113111 [Saccharopolyspora kobensis]
MSPLSSDELREIRDELNAGTTPTVWFTGSAIGVPEGRSGKVISLGEPAEGDFIQVRPAGSKDVLSFSAAEVTKVKPPRKRAAAPEPAKPAPSAPKPKTVGATLPRVSTAAQAKPAQSTAKPAAEAAKPSAEEKPAARRKPRPPKAVGGATVTLTADDDGQWSVEVSTPKKRVLKPTPVQAGAVAQAAKALHDDVAAAVEPLIEAAREQQRARVEQLRAELAAAEAALNDLRS